MKKHTVILFLILGSLTTEIFGQESVQNEDPNMAIFHADSLFNDLRSNNKRWTSFFKGTNVLTGLYHLKAGEEDRQKPHDTDEVYYIIEGKGKFLSDGKETLATKGSILFVKAEVEHRFLEITEDLVILVFFDQ